jgi:hypothetical protein
MICQILVEHRSVSLVSLKPSLNKKKKDCCTLWNEAFRKEDFVSYTQHCILMLIFPKDIA